MGLTLRPADFVESLWSAIWECFGLDTAGLFWRRCRGCQRLFVAAGWLTGWRVAGASNVGYCHLLPSDVLARGFVATPTDTRKGHG